MELRDYLRVLRRRWLLVVATALVAVGAAAGISLAQTPQYAATARLFVSTPTGNEATDAYQGGLYSQQQVTSYATLITGEEVTAQVAGLLEDGSTARDVSAELRATVVPETTLLDVTATDPDPARAQALANATADVFTAYVQEIERAPIEATVTDAADLPDTPVSPQVLRNVGLAAVLGLLLGIGLAVLRETLDTSVKDADTVTELTDAPVLGGVQYDSNAARRPLVTDLDSHAPRVEAFRVLRTNLQFVRIDRSSKVIVITSSLPGEGKTTTAVNLAITLAQAGQRTCLLEADLRRPKVAEYLRLEGAVGLTTVLIGRTPLAEALQPWGEQDLAVLTSGTIPPNPAELVQSHEMRLVIDELRTRFDVIIVDAPPLLPVTDAALLAAEADGAVLVVRHGTTTREQLRGAAERLQAVGGRVVGAVLSMTSARRGDRYGYGYGYGYGYAPQPGRRKSDDAETTRPARL